MVKNKVSLRNFISREFFKAALLPLLVIEITLLVLYFSMNAYIHGKSVKTLGDDRLSHLMGIVSSQTHTMNEQIRMVSALSRLLQSETTRFFDNPERYPVPVEKPEFGLAPNGVYYKLNNNGGCSVFYSRRYPVGPREKEKALRSEALDPLYKNIHQVNGNVVAVYLNTFDSMNRYYPFFENVYEQIDPDMDIPTFNFYYLADAEHNPAGGPVWTKAYLDPMGQGWMMSCIVPIYKGSFLEGVAGIDITITNFIENLLTLQLPWGAHAFLADANGTIMAMPPAVGDIFGLSELKTHDYTDVVRQDTHKPEAFNLLKSVLPAVAGPISQIIRKETGRVEFLLETHPYILGQDTVADTGWKLMVLADKDKILAPIYRLERHTRHVGIAAAGFMVLFYVLFFLYLVTNTRRMSGRIAAPVASMSQAIQRLGDGKYETQLARSDVAELDEVSNSFKNMAKDLKALHEDLKTEVKRANTAKTAARKAEEQLARHQRHLENVVASRTKELRDANDRLQADIVKRKKVEKALDLERRQLLSIFDSIDEPVYVSTADTHELLYVNEAFKQYFPCEIGDECYRVLQNLDAPCPFCTNYIIFGKNMGKPYIWEFYNQFKKRWFRCIDRAIQWPGGRMVRYEMAIDITEQKQASHEKKRLMARLRRAEKMEALGTLAGGVAHDLNNVLGGLVGYPDLLLLDIPEDSPLRRGIETIRDSGQKAAAIVQDLLTLARRGVSVMERININAIIAAYLASPEHENLQQHHPGIRFDVEYSDNLLDVMGSPVHLSKTAMNIISNAAESLTDGGQVSISTHNRYVDKPVKGYDEVKEGDYVVLSVTDHGVGISPADLDRIFEPFYTKKKMGRSGTGLGMAVVWGTVKDHQGYIEVKSTEGIGTTLEIYLPATRKELAAAAFERDTKEYTGSGEKILVVDDVAIQREIAVGMLDKLGYSAASVSSGEEAVEYLEENTVDLLVLDMIMDPNIDGLETYKRVLKINPGQKAIIVSGFSETDAIKETQKLGAGKYVKKPYTAGELGRAIQEELNN